MTDQITRNQFTDEHRSDVCRIGQGHLCCRYLTLGADGWDCEKNTNLAALLDQRAERGGMSARSDNCGGLPKRATS